jgi:hypothetical protein
MMHFLGTGTAPTKGSHFIETQSVTDISFEMKEP